MADFSLGGTLASTKYFETGKIFPLLLPEQKDIVANIPRFPGQIQMSKKFMGGGVGVRGVLYASSKTQLLTRLSTFASYLYSEDTAQFIDSDRDDRYYLVHHMKTIELEDRRRFVPLELQFQYYDPFAYAVTANSNTESGITSNGYNWNETNNGDYYAYPVVTITFNQVQTHVYIANNTISGNRMDITKAFVATDELEIDSKNITVKLNSSESPGGVGTGGSGAYQFPMLVGEGTVNQMEIGTTDATIDVDVKVEYNKPYFI
jgi:phage-related protein